MSQLMYIILVVAFLILIFSVIFYWITKGIKRKFSDDKWLPYIPFVIVFSVLCNLIMFILYDLREFSGYAAVFLLAMMILVFIILALGSVFGVLLGLRSAGDKRDKNKI